MAYSADASDACPAVLFVSEISEEDETARN
jgi:hypothetical protein